MKYFYYAAMTISGLIFMLYMFGPYGGPLGVWDVIRDGFYDPDYITTSFSDSVAETLIYINQFIAVVFFGAILLCLALPFFLKMDASLKYKIAIGCLLVIGFIIFFPKVFRFFLVVF